MVVEFQEMEVHMRVGEAKFDLLQTAIHFGIFAIRRLQSCVSLPSYPVSKL